MARLLKNLKCLSFGRHALLWQATLRAFPEVRSKALPEGHWLTANTQSALGECLTKFGRYAEAEALLLESYPIIKGADGAHPKRKAEALQRLIDLHNVWCRPEQAA